MFEDWEGWLFALGVLSGALSAIAYVPYIIDTVRGKTGPQRSSWLIWSILGFIALFSQIYEGASASLWFAAVQVAGTVIVFLLSISKGFGAYIKTPDVLVLGAATAGVLLWYWTDTSAYALAITISISLLGGSLTAAKAYQDPDSETLSTWVVSFIASALAVVAVGSLTPILLAYPLYLLTLYGTFIIAILAGRARQKMPLAQAPQNVVARVPIRDEANRSLVVADRLNGVRPNNSIDP